MPALQTPSSCNECRGNGEARTIIEQFIEQDFGHNQCKRCGLTFDSNVEERLAENIDRIRIENIDSREDYMKLFVETWEIGDEESDDVYTNFDWEDNEALRAGVTRHVIEAVKRHGTPSNPPQFLDLGCGNGFTTIEYSKEFGREHIIGIDPSPTVRSLTKKHEIAAIQGTLDTVDLPDGSFDAVFIIGNLMLHFNPMFTLSETFRILKPGGLVIFDFKNTATTIRKLAAVAARISPKRLGRHHLVQRNFLNMRYGFDKKYIRREISRIGFDELECYSKPPRLLEFSNASGYQKGLKGLVWRLTNWIDGIRDERAWVQVTARKPKSYSNS